MRVEAREEGALGGGIRPWVNLTPRVTPWRHRGVSLRSRLGREDGLLFAATLFDFYLSDGGFVVVVVGALGHGRHRGHGFLGVHPHLFLQFGGNVLSENEVLKAEPSLPSMASGQHDVTHKVAGAWLFTPHKNQRS